ncbi:phosphoribosylanthranilate isomerase TRP1 KNAG_0J01040 [Huiozyma naganishii CBS 8797]|uniref:N-(5'-phosphoribosyl)anthranilate isomerase n=1 Tax=Huiozyma naganishii (strain ATCC MYA-139 / BCRC 22969 / CBS 8797 / KCTC 17520 / NBRC 10181 / NCYC 3082 / Yp74L-3) TaxID=1071383 RepID=J7SAI0_HUIN7|nr:hypothetical protein KNAG_0J01040 [Kazachstania naganishii CBS 8797]CCK72186.1 hypothetical protein KNAG_0J01040 [Kazachstania naganishii CBS 8797]
MDRFDTLSGQECLVKVCGLQTYEAAERALVSGANLIGIICVPGRKRTIEPSVAKSISGLIHSDGQFKDRCLVGVFRNQPKEQVKQIADEYNVDAVQLHGDEDWLEYHQFIGKPVIKRMIFDRDCDTVVEICHDSNLSKLCIPLFDSEAGGTGEKLNWGNISKWTETVQPQPRFILAGGLTPENVAEAISLPGVVGVDVSGGVETDGVKDLNKISQFVANGKKVKAR